MKQLDVLKNWWKQKKEELARHQQARKNIKQRLAQKKQSRYKLKPYLERAGLNFEVHKLSAYFFNFCIALNLALSAYLIYYFASNFGFSVYFVLFVMAVVWTVIFVLLLFVIWLLFHFILDLRIFQRKVAIEEVLPDFLELTSANIRAGMPIDRALWYAVRPRFGVLAKEIEIVAKETMSGEDLENALQKFAAKYDSLTLKRSVNLLVEGIHAGGEIGELLNKISINIKESQLLKKEMSANVTSYAIFISFATILAAPFLFGLSYQLLSNITSITATLGSANAPSVMGLNFGGGVGITMADFRTFAYLSLSITSFFSAVLVASIKKGDIKAGLRYIPIFMITSIIVFKIASWMMAGLFSGLF
ncbi:MAG: type II secretion system F family protein [Candidatus Woesearchaeota archaeon]